MNNTGKWASIWSALGEQIRTRPDGIELARLRSMQQNPWFTADHIDFALNGICNQMLAKIPLETWLAPYESENKKSEGKTVGIICAGNIPMVGFHDIMCTITAGHRALVKLSNKDQFLLPAIFNELAALFPEIAESIQFVDKLTSYDAVIATGSNNSLRYFNFYFKHVPNLFRHNRTSVGVIHEGDEIETLTGIADDIFIHFGLGCRNISKLFIPKSFDLDKLFTATLKYAQYGIHSKYRNNFIYHTALFQMNLVDYLTNDLFILLNSEEWHAPLSVIYFEYYSDLSEVQKKLRDNDDVIQAVYSSKELEFIKVYVPGSGQMPALWDYADNVDTMKWLYAL